MEKLLALKNISLNFGRRRILNSVNLELSRGEIVAITGSNGVGKTSVLSLIAGNITADSGEIEFAKSARSVVFVADKPALYPDWTVENFLCWNAQMLAADGNSAKRFDVETVIRACSLSSVLTDKCGLLSHGFRQRVALAVGLLANPDILLLDEPGNGLDPAQRLELGNILRTLRQETAILMVHHDLGEVCKLSDRIYDLDNGEFLEIALPSGEFICAEWDSAELAADSDWQDENFALYFCESDARQEKIKKLASTHGLLAIYQEYPARALQIRRDALRKKKAA
ncbi:MAG: ABC transporter ATP-binding protein [Cardiobacteriaceae bacterium]|nr:ABC transporter ATP-binding protein [Cardiobacteriaceae bacterium]